MEITTVRVCLCVRARAAHVQTTNCTSRHICTHRYICSAHTCIHTHIQAFIHTLRNDIGLCLLAPKQAHSRTWPHASNSTKRSYNIGYASFAPERFRMQLSNQPTTTMSVNPKLIAKYKNEDRSATSQQPTGPEP